MAGGKETPRQKMIGMMYLVLTALLALNVSSTVIEKFVFINESLHKANEETTERNLKTLEAMRKTVKETGNREADVAVLTVADEIRAETSSVNEKLVEYKQTMIEITGGYKEGHEPEYAGDAKELEGMTDYDKVGNYMMPVEEGGEGNGAKLKETLNSYVEFVQNKLLEAGVDQEALTNFHDIAVDADRDPVYMNDPNQKGKKFSQLAFESSPTPASIATMSEFQSRVLSYETTALDLLSKKVGAGDLKFDNVFAMVKPKSEYVASGVTYEADLFIAASSTGVTPEMYVNGNKIDVEEGMGKVRIAAKATSFDDENKSAKTFDAMILVPKPGGKDTITQTFEYFVTKPVIQIQSQSVSALYLNCGNELDVQVPALGNEYQPSFNAKGGYTIGGKGGKVTVVPNSKKVTLSVSSAGNYIGSQDFSVRKIPQPEIIPYTDRGPVDQKTGMPAKTPRIKLNVKPDESFAEFLPKDAKFRVSSCVATLVSGGIGRATVNSNGDVLNLGQIAANARKGDQIVIEIRGVQRQNFRGQVEDFKINSRYIRIGLN